MKDKDRAEFEEIFEQKLAKLIPELVRSVVKEEINFLVDYDKKIQDLNEKFETKLNEVKTAYDELVNELQTGPISKLSADLDTRVTDLENTLTTNTSKLIKDIEEVVKSNITKNRDAIRELADKIFSLKDKTLETISERDKLEQDKHDLQKLVSPHRDAIERLHTLNQIIVQGAGTLTTDTLRSQLENVRDKIQMEEASAPFITLVLRKFREIVNELNRERDPLETPALMTFKEKIDFLISEIKEEEAKYRR